MDTDINQKRNGEEFNFNDAPDINQKRNGNDGMGYNQNDQLDHLLYSM